MSENSSHSAPIAGKSALIGSRYVGALFAQSQEEGLVDAVVADMLNLRVLWTQCAEWRAIANNPRFTLEFARAAVEQVSKIALLNKLTSNFLLIVAQNHRLGILPSLIDMFMDEVSRHRGEHRADVRSARPLTEAQQQKLASALEGALGGRVRLVTIEDPSIIGGLTVKVGSKVVDASVKTKLDRLEHILKETNAAA
ncbi:MAG: ATP synthase F1 subunit delta [Alphaproteobacteria bacterium]|nr:ATP synthase F1 subunit delta [Alphaproteobacteria bacterium]